MKVLIWKGHKDFFCQSRAHFKSHSNIKIRTDSNQNDLHRIELYFLRHLQLSYRWIHDFENQWKLCHFGQCNPETRTHMEQEVDQNSYISEAIASLHCLTLQHLRQTHFRESSSQHTSSLQTIRCVFQRFISIRNMGNFNFFHWREIDSWNIKTFWKV